MSLSDIYEILIEYWPLLAMALILLLLGIWSYVRRHGQARQLDRLLQGISAGQLIDVLIPDGLDGQIYLDRLLLVRQGLVVLDVKRVAGPVFASDQMDDWTVITPQRRYSFANPQSSLHDRVAAIRSLVPGAKVQGYVLFPETADFSKGRPSHILMESELASHYPKLSRQERMDVLRAHNDVWQRLQEASVDGRLGQLMSE